jgi:hypothetical protein
MLSGAALSRSQLKPRYLQSAHSVVIDRPALLAQTRR